MSVGGEHVLVRSTEPVPPGPHRLGVRVRRLTREAQPTERTGPGVSEFTLLIDGIPSGRIESRLGFYNFVSWTGLDIGRDRGSPVSDYTSPFAFTGKLVKVTVTMDDDQTLDAEGVRRARRRMTERRGRCGIILLPPPSADQSAAVALSNEMPVTGGPLAPRLPRFLDA